MDQNRFNRTPIFQKGLQNFSYDALSATSLIFEISYGESFYCRSNNFSQETNRESAWLQKKMGHHLVKLKKTWKRLAVSGAPEGRWRTTRRLFEMFIECILQTGVKSVGKLPRCLVRPVEIVSEAGGKQLKFWYICSRNVCLIVTYNFSNMRLST